MKATKKLVSLVLTLAMVMCLGLTAFAAANPITSGTLTVTGDQLQGKNVTAVRVFTANVDDKNNNNMIDEGDIVSYELEEPWRAFFNGEVTNKADADVTNEEAYEYVKSLNPEEKLIAFAKRAKAYFNEHADEFGEQKVVQTADSHNTATFTGLKVGYYLVLPENGSTMAGRATDAMIVNVPGQKASHLELKTEYPSVDKTIAPDGSHGSTAQIGDKVKFVLTSKVPNMDEYTTYFFNFKDTMSKGLTPDANSVKVTIGGQVVAKDGNYTVDVTPGQTDDATLFEIKFADLKKVTAATAGVEIKVEYEATLNDKAVIGNAGNPNEVVLEYSNNPGSEEHGKTQPSITKTHTFEVNVHKYANDEQGVPLPGAVFQLQDVNGTPIKLVKESATAYHVATGDEINAARDTLVETFVTVDAGDITIKGLKAGKYKLVETEAPVGYNKLSKPIELEIKAELEADGSLRADYPQYIVNNGVASQDNTINVQNKNGAFLPETGSIGTVGLTILGVAVVVIGMSFTSHKKKEQY